MVLSTKEPGGAVNYWHDYQVSSKWQLLQFVSIFHLSDPCDSWSEWTHDSGAVTNYWHDHEVSKWLVSLPVTSKISDWHHGLTVRFLQVMWNKTHITACPLLGQAAFTFTTQNATLPEVVSQQHQRYFLITKQKVECRLSIGSRQTEIFQIAWEAPNCSENCAMLCIYLLSN